MGIDNIDKLRLLNTEFKERLDRQASSAASIDTKATTVLGFSIALGAFVVSQRALEWWRVGPIVLIVVSCIAAALAMGLRTYQDTPDPTEAFLRTWMHDGVSESMTLMALVQLRSEVFLLNRSANKSKACAWKVSAVFLMLSAAVSAGLILSEGKVT